MAFKSSVIEASLLGFDILICGCELAAWGQSGPAEDFQILRFLLVTVKPLIQSVEM